MRRLTRSRGVLLTAVGVATLVVGGGIASGENINCTMNPCNGTPEKDSINGTTGADEIHARGGNDTALGGEGGSDLVFGNAGNDHLHGDVGFDRSLDGEDEVYGGGGRDDVAGAGATDLLDGGSGKDSIDARDDLFAGSEVGLIPGVDRVEGGTDNDEIQAAEVLTPFKDRIDCGGGDNDSVVFDKGLDTVRRCENKSGISP